MRAKPQRILLIILASAFILACDINSILPGSSARPVAQIQSPEGGSNFKEGDEIAIQSTSRDPAGVVRVELLVDGQVAVTDAPPIPQGQVSFSLVQKWKATSGSHTISVRAYNAAGIGSDPANITIQVASVQQSALASPTPGGVIPPLSSGSTPGAAATSTSGSSSSPPTATRRPNTPTPTRVAASPTTSAAPGVYAAAIRVDPANPKSNVGVTFFVRFLNTTGEIKHLRWFVKIYLPEDSRNSKGETAKITTDIPLGTSEFVTGNDWKTIIYSDCQQFYARPFAYDPDSVSPFTEFLKTDGQPVNQGFQVCP